MQVTKFFTFFYLFFCVLFCSSGPIGHIQFYNFPYAKKNVEKAIWNVINKDFLYTLPIKWRDLYSLPSPVKLLYVYFPSSPEEVYQIGFTGDQEEWNTSNTSPFPAGDAPFSVTIGDVNGDNILDLATCIHHPLQQKVRVNMD